MPTHTLQVTLQLAREGIRRMHFNLALDKMGYSNLIWLQFKTSIKENLAFMYTKDPVHVVYQKTRSNILCNSNNC